MQKITTSTEETEQLGIEISTKLRGGDIVLLSGNLGAGKTALVKGIAKGFGITNTITSPTFTLMNIYDVRNTKDTKLRKMIHVDTYRLKEEQELVEIGAEDYLGKPDTVCLIEWPDKIEGLLKKFADFASAKSSILDFSPQKNRDNPKNFVSIEIKQLENSNEREIKVDFQN